MRSIPGPPGLPFLGNTIELVKSDDLHALRLELARKYGKIYKTRIIFGKRGEADLSGAWPGQVLANSRY